MANEDVRTRLTRALPHRIAQLASRQLLDPPGRPLGARGQARRDDQHVAHLAPPRPNPPEHRHVARGRQDVPLAGARARPRRVERPPPREARRARRAPEPARHGLDRRPLGPGVARPAAHGPRAAQGAPRRHARRPRLGARGARRERGRVRHRDGEHASPRRPHGEARGRAQEARRRRRARTRRGARRSRRARGRAPGPAPPGARARRRPRGARRRAPRGARARQLARRRARQRLCARRLAGGQRRLGVGVGAQPLGAAGRARAEERQELRRDLWRVRAHGGRARERACRDQTSRRVPRADLGRHRGAGASHLSLSRFDSSRDTELRD